MSDVLMSPRDRLKILPYLVTKIVLGAEVVREYLGKENVVSVEWGGTQELFHVDDFNLANDLADSIDKEWIKPLVKFGDFGSSKFALDVHLQAQERLLAMSDSRANQKSLVMLRDKGGCGWWRMTFPARYLTNSGWYVDITDGGLSIGALLEYDTIFVQRVYQWGEFYILEKLKRAGKRIIYDIDDDIFHIPAHNQASKAMGRDQMCAAIACMNVSDVITTTTNHLVSILREAGVDTPIEIVPNAVDLEDSWLPTSQTGSPDDKQRIFWAGSDTHSVDWEGCMGAVSQVMDNRKNVILVIMGAIPRALAERAERWPGRVEHLAPMEPESYYEIIHHIRADVGLLPLTDELFNKSKSPLKFVEYSMIGIPSVASDVQPYSGVITPEENGLLVKNTRDWRKAISRCLDDSALRRRLVSGARKTVQACFNIEKVVPKWENILFGSRPEG